MDGPSRLGYHHLITRTKLKALGYGFCQIALVPTS